jgi:cell division protein FtsB
MSDKTNIMEKLEPHIARAKAYLLSLRDVRNVGVLVFTVILLLITWSGIKAIQTNYGLEKQIARLQQENDVQSLDNANASLQNQYFSSDQYKEVTARENLGLGMAGETELLVSKSTALAHTVHPKGAAKSKSSVPEQTFWQRNFQEWVDFFLHRGNAAD